MPELPEVESIKLHLTKYLIGHKIIRVEVNFRKTLKEREGKLVGGKINAIKRFGKVLTIDLDNGYSALIHLKMTGQLIYRGPNLRVPSELSEKVLGGVPGKHTHVIFYLDKKGILYFNDYRKFGWIKVVKTHEVAGSDFIGKLGPEFLKDLTLAIFRSTLFKTKKPIKLLLLDQEKMAGIGNIYANDALFLAGIDPRRSSNKLNNKEQKILHNSILIVLKEGIMREGASENAFVNPDGKEGKYQDYFLVYDRKGEKCRKCGSEIEKIKLGGRGTYFCPECQK